MVGQPNWIVRSALLSLALITLVALSLPLFIGLWLDRWYLGLIKDVGHARWMRVESATFDRGWFRSKASLIVHLDGLKPRYVIEHWISHGPILFGTPDDWPGTGLGFARGRLAEVESAVEHQRPIVLGQSWMGFGGDLRSHWREPLRLESGVDRRLDLEVDAQTRRLDLRLTHPHLSPTLGDQSVVIDDLGLEVRLRMLDGGFFPEDLALTAGRIGVDVLDSSLSFFAPELAAVFDGSQGRLSAELVATVERIGEARHGAGPVGIKARLADLGQLGLGWPVAFPPAPALPEPLGKRSPRIDVADLTIDTSEGRFVANASLLLDPQFYDWRHIELDADLRMARSLLHSQLEQLFRQRLSRSDTSDGRRAARAGGALATEEIDERAATRAEKQLAILVTRGYLSRVGSDVRTRLRLRSGRLSLNGKAVELATIMRE